MPSPRRTNRTRLAVLGALSLGSASGTELREDLERTVGHFWHESYGQLYPTLRQLVTDGAATVEVEPSRASRGRPRRIYTITPAGEAELDRWLSEPPLPPPPPRNEFLLKLFFGARVPVQVTQDHVRHHRDLLEAQRAEYEAIERQLDAPDIRSRPAHAYWLATVRYGRALTESALAWCDDVRERLEVDGHP